MGVLLLEVDMVREREVDVVQSGRWWRLARGWRG